MSFSSCTFLFIFFPITFITFYFSPAKVKKYSLMMISLIFYMLSSVKTIPILMSTIIVNYLIGLAINKFSKKKTILALGILINVALLLFYKYTNFIFTNINNIFSTNIKAIDIILPLGISFFIFQTISYIVDVYKNKIKAEKNIINFAIYVSFFPRIVSGPIVRYEQFQENISNLKKPNLEDITAGIRRICFGLGKVLILSNIMGEVWNLTYSSNVSALAAWFGIVCYSFQLYLNFSGYMDIALGLGRLFSINLPENFDFPYTSASISEFWRRWHITLSSWFRDYVYIPLGGNRRGNVYLNLFIVFLLTGLWHGASWNFILWGVYHGIWIIFERIIRDKKLYKMIPKIIKQISTYIIVLGGWVLFAAGSTRGAIQYYKSMLGIQGVNYQFDIRYFLNKYYIFFLVVSILVSLPILRKITDKQKENVKEIVSGIFALVIFIISIMFMINNAYTPSLYAQF